MSWRSSGIVDQRKEFVLRSLDQSVVFLDLCREYGISRKTGYKWRERFLREGLDAMGDRSRRPHSSPSQLPEDTVCELVRLKTKHMGWGARKVRKLFDRSHGHAPSESSVKRVLEKAGLVKKRRKRRARPQDRLQSPEPASEPNDRWTVDFKGWWLTPGRQRCEPLTIRDDYSRYILGVEAMSTSRTEPVRDVFERVFSTYGLPKIIRSDNGTPFACSNAPLGLSRLSTWWIALGIEPDRIAPGHPEQNGAHERMHLDMSRELQGQILGDLREHQAAFDVWRQEYNWERPHEALEMRTPAEVYRKSVRPYEKVEYELQYPVGYHVRKVTTKGMIRIKGQALFLSETLTGWNVGLEPLDIDRYAIWFDRFRLGEIELSSQSVQWAQTKGA